VFVVVRDLFSCENMRANVTLQLKFLSATEIARAIPAFDTNKKRIMTHLFS
jgi:hypothetical protein